MTRDDRLTALRQAMDLAHTQGVTSVQNAGVSVEDFALYDELRKQGELDLRVYNAISASSGLSDADVTKFEAVRTEYADDPVLKAGAVKLMLDGVVESYTAAMLEPYANRATLGQINFTQAELDRVVAMLDKRGWQIFIHAIGDRGIRSALDAFEHAARANPPPARGRRHRIEHIETLDPADLPRFGTLGVIASQQPYHGSPAPNQIEVWKTNLGEPRASRSWMYNSLLAGGAHIAFGSDWPVVPLIRAWACTSPLHAPPSMAFPRADGSRPSGSRWRRPSTATRRRARGRRLTNSGRARSRPGCWPTSSSSPATSSSQAPNCWTHTSRSPSSMAASSSTASRRGKQNRHRVVLFLTGDKGSGACPPE